MTQELISVQLCILWNHVHVGMQDVVETSNGYANEFNKWQCLPNKLQILLE